MSQNKTIETDASVTEFLQGVENEGRRRDAFALLEIMRRTTGVEPKMWGPAIVGFGTYRYRYDSGREGDMLRVGFSPRKANLVIYLSARDGELLDSLTRLGKHKNGSSCIYVNRLPDVDLGVLEGLVDRSWRLAHELYGANPS